MSEILVNTIKKADGTGSITVPAETGTVLTSATALSSFPSGFVNGITEYDMYRLTNGTGFSNQDIMTGPLERVDTDNFEKIGTGVSESSGIFTLPSTGYWKITMFGQFTSGGVRNYVGVRIDQSVDSGSNYDSLANAYGNIGNNNAYAQAIATGLVKITNASTARIRVAFEMDNDCTVVGSTGSNFTYIEFIKIGEV